MNEDIKAILGGILPIPEAILPVKYLGVRLTSTRLRAVDRGLLKEIFLQSIQGWSPSLLSYGGRAQLIQSVLFSV